MFEATQIPETYERELGEWKNRRRLGAMPVWSIICLPEPWADVFECLECVVKCIEHGETDFDLKL